MRRSVQPNCPRAMTCCFFVSLKMLAMPAEGPRSLPPRQRLERLLPMAVFQVSMYGRFWVSTEAVMVQLQRVKVAGVAVREEMGVNCCHANQDKFWVQDPDGVEWEVYHLNYDLEGEANVPASRPNRLPVVEETGCCAPRPSGT